MALTREERLKLADIDPELAEVRIWHSSCFDDMTYTVSDPQKNHDTSPKP
jgi:hypothetical protein